MHATAPLPLLRVPPFPRSRPRRFGNALAAKRTDAELDDAIGALVEKRVGGTFWGCHPTLPDSSYVLVDVPSRSLLEQILERVPANQPVVCWNASKSGEQRLTRPGPIAWLTGCCDPWHLVEDADEVIGHAGSELLLIAAVAGKRATIFDANATWPLESRADARQFITNHAAMNFRYSNPFNGDLLTFSEAVSLCGFWRALIDSNRPLVAAIGFAAWKRATVAPLLWQGSDIPFDSPAENVHAGEKVALWKSRTSPSVLGELQRRQAHLVEVEDGFIRSVGLGADCVPPLSIVVDRLGAYFDPSTPSELEQMIEQGGFVPELIERAKALRALIVEQGISKYASSDVVLQPRAGEGRHLLVAGQVEDDRSVMTGGGLVATNLELLRRVRSLAPDAFITYKPHPDVEAGHRVGAIAPKIALSLADEVVCDQPIGALIDIVDEVHVNTSLAGFEALLRGKSVVAHGVPFYAGWGLTRDLGAVPARRTARRTIDEIVAAVLLLYPRYLDPVTGLPCPPEILVSRLANPDRLGGDGMLVTLRRLQGRLKLGLASLRGGHLP
jgi:capsular polysaccharide export protein